MSKKIRRLVHHYYLGKSDEELRKMAKHITVYYLWDSSYRSDLKHILRLYSAVRLDFPTRKLEAIQVKTDLCPTFTSQNAGRSVLCVSIKVEAFIKLRTKHEIGEI